MASNVSREFERAFEEAMNEIDKKMEIAFKRTMKRMEAELFEVMKKATVQNFYHGYFPSVYQRTYQLHKAISLEVKDKSHGNIMSFNVIPEYDESEMDHSVYKVKAVYKHRKKDKSTGKYKHTGKTSVYEYTVRLKDNKKPDEEKIMEMTLGAGFHPNVGTANTDAPIWLDDEDDTGVLFDALEDYVNQNASRIFNEEYDKL